MGTAQSSQAVRPVKAALAVLAFIPASHFLGKTNNPLKTGSNVNTFLFSASFCKCLESLLVPFQHEFLAQTLRALYLL